MLGGGNVPKVVVSWRAFLQVYSEHRSVQRGDGVAEECFHLIWRHGVDRIHRKSEETIVINVWKGIVNNQVHIDISIYQFTLLKLGTDFLRKLYGLVGYGRSSNFNGVEVYVA